MKKTYLALTILLLAAGASFAQTLDLTGQASPSVALTAQRMTTRLPDGKTVSMWGFCQTGTCTTAWTPGPTIIVSANSGLTINLTNALPVPTSLVILGQLGGGLGQPDKDTVPQHPVQTVTTWPANGGGSFTPPAQGQRARSFSPEAPANASQSYSWASLKPGTYLYETGTHPSLQVPMGLYGVLIVTSPATAGAAAGGSGVAYPGFSYDADATYLFSEIDAVENAAVDAAALAGANEYTPVTDPSCAGGACYPAAVNYAPTYLLINGKSFDPTNVGASTVSIGTTARSGNVLLRFLNAGSRTHIPTVVGARFGLIAEDGNPLPGYPKIQSEVLLTAGKTVDVRINPPVTSGIYADLTLPMFDRQLGTSINNQKSGGMQAYLVIGAGGSGSQFALPASQGAQANNDSFTLPIGATSFSGNVLTNDIGVTNASTTLALSSAAQTLALNYGTVTLKPDGSFTYVLNPGTAVTSATTDSFAYYGNGALTATVTLSATALGGAPRATDQAFSSNLQNLLKVSRPGALTGATDPTGYALTAVLDTTALPAGLTAVTLNADGSLTATATAPGPYTLQFHVVNSQRTKSTPANNLVLNFANPANGKVIPDTNFQVLDAQNHAPISDYSWIIEEDTTYKTTPGVTTPPGTPSLSTSFHKSHMPLVASGCVGAISCRSGQQALDPTTGLHAAVAANPETRISDVVLDPGKYYYISVLPGDGGDSFIGGGGVPVSGDVTRLSESGFVVSATLSDPTGLVLGDAIVIAGATDLRYNGQWVVTGISGNVVTYTAKAKGLPTLNSTIANNVTTPAGSFARIFKPAVDCVQNAAPGSGNCGHVMGGTALAPSQTSATVLVEPSPLPAADLNIFIFEDNSPTNGDIDTLEAAQGLGGFSIILNDIAGATGDPTGQITYDMFNMPLTNALVGTVDTATGLDMCPAIPAVRQGNGVKPGTGITTGNGLVGVIITCPQYEADGRTPSPLAGHALIRNLPPDRYDVIANPGADREASGEVWLQTSTLEGTRAQDAFTKAGEPAYFQEFGPPGFHSFIGFVNPAHLNAKIDPKVRGSLCFGSRAAGCRDSIQGQVSMLHMSRPSSMVLYDSKSRDTLSQTTCYAGLNSGNGSSDNIAFAQCDSNGNFSFSGIPDGTYQVVVWDQWLDQIINYTSVTVPDPTTQATSVNMGTIPVFSWFTRIETSAFLDQNGSHLAGPNRSWAASTAFALGNTVLDSSSNLQQVQTAGTTGTAQPAWQTAANATTTDGTVTWINLGPANPGISEIPMTVRFRDGSISNTLFTDSSGHASFDELFPLFNWYVVESDTTRYKSSAVHIAVDGGGDVASDPNYPGVLTSHYPTGESSIRNDIPGSLSYGVQSFISQTLSLDWGKTAYAPNETGGILGMVVYASTRPFDDPMLLIQNVWAPGVPNVAVNLYQETTGADGSTLLNFVESTQTSGWDDWTRVDANGMTVNMSCPGQLPGGPNFDATHDPYAFYNLTPQAQFTCYDGFHNWNQAQPAVYDGRYLFKTMPDGVTPLPAGKYVVEVVVPAGYELVKEEDKNILIGDAYIAPVQQQFSGLGNVFILPDQATLGNANPNNPPNANGIQNNPTTDLGHSNDTTVPFPPCVGQARVVPDYLSLFPGSGQVAPFAGATRALCDRKEVTLQPQAQANASFYIFTPTQIASHYTGMVLDDASSEFNIAAPDFGEKFSVPFVPVSIRDFNGIEISRTYTDQYGMFNGLVFSSWEVNPPNPTGFAPNMMITCMNDPGPIPDPAHPGQRINDPNYNPSYSNFCYTNPFMPGRTDYLDTPVLPVAAFAAGYNPVDCAYPDATPAIAEVDGDGVGPYVSGAGSTLTITALGDVAVPNNAYIGPFASASTLAGQKQITRHYGFGNTAGTVSIEGLPLTNVVWGDLKITGTVPAGAATGELQIQNAAGVKSIDTVTITVGGPAPTRVTAPSLSTSTSTGLQHPIQDAIDAANPGELIMLGPGTYPELVIMWKPVRLQGVGAASTIINAAKYPTQKLDLWRPRINCLFGLDVQGNTLTAQNAPLAGCPANQLNAADVLPGQEITGGVILLEPSVLGTEEGAGVTVLAKNLPRSACGTNVPGSQSNFLCAPSRIDGISITGGDAGGGIYANGWAHNLEIANNRIYGNAGAFSGGVRIGQPYLEGQRLPQGVGANYVGLGYDTNVNIHHNKITNNGTVEANNGLAGGGGGLSICSGTDNYKVNYNFICGNFSQGDGGGLGHIGFSQNGQITSNQILFNQSFNQSSTTNGGGLVVEGEPSTLGGLTIGTGNLFVDSNLILGNHAQGGNGGGVRLQQVNGADIGAGHRNGLWQVSLTNNMIVNNVAGLAGGGISVMDTTNSSIINNTIVSNDSTATAGAAFPASATRTSRPQPAGISSEPHSPALAGVANTRFSNPTLTDNIIFQNRSFYFSADQQTSGTVAAATHLYPAFTTAELAPSTSRYSCPGGATYWDLGLVNDPDPTTHQNGSQLNPTYSVLSSSNLIGAGQYATTNKVGTTSMLAKQYCNGPRSNPGTPDAGTGPLVPLRQFTMQAAATEDEGGNWIDVRYGPLSLSDSSAYSAAGTVLPALGDYHLAAVASNVAVDQGTATGASNHDFDGQSRPIGAGYDIGADEVGVAGTAKLVLYAGTATVPPSPAVFPATRVISNPNGNNVTFTLDNTQGTASANGISVSGLNGSLLGGFFRNGGTCGTTLAAGTTCTIVVRFSAQAILTWGVQTTTMSVTAGSSIVASSPVNLSATVYQVNLAASAPSFSYTPANGSNRTKTVTVRNYGSTSVALGNPLAAFSGATGSGSFTVTGGTCTAGGMLPAAVVPGVFPSTCTISVQFTSAGNGTTTGTMNITDADTSSPQSVSLTGTRP